MKKGKSSKIYALMLTLVCIVSMCGVVSAYQVKTFKYTCDYPNQSYRTQSIKKENASSGHIYYQGGLASYIRVEMWGADGSSANYKNFTYPHKEGNFANATYYNVPLGEGRLLLNTVYEYYKHTCYASLVVQSYSTGTVSGTWSSMTD